LPRGPASAPGAAGCLSIVLMSQQSQQQRDGPQHQPQSQPQGRRQRRTVAPSAAAALALAVLLQLSACQPAAANTNITLDDAGGAALRTTGLRSRCGHEHDDAEYAQARQSIAAVQRMGALNYNARVAFSGVTVPTFFHVISKADGTGNVTLARIQKQMNVTNQGFGPHFTFMLQGVDYIANNVWFSNAA
jgi:hypothetical protein